MPDESFYKAKFDQGKPRWDLLPWRPILGVVKVLTFGAEKYDDDSWRSVPDAKRRYFAALMRHLYAWTQGENIDPESGFHHLEHAMCNLVFLCELCGLEE